MIAAIVRGVGVTLPSRAALKLSANGLCAVSGVALASRVALLAVRPWDRCVLQVEGALAC